jgi:hypothetical protein
VGVGERSRSRAAASLGPRRTQEGIGQSENFQKLFGYTRLKKSGWEMKAEKLTKKEEYPLADASPRFHSGRDPPLSRWFWSRRYTFPE